MSRKSTPSKSETHHSETPSQKRARHSADGGMFTKGPVTAEEITVSAVGEAAAEAASAKTAANEAIANAKRLEKIAKDMQKKTPLTVQPKSSTPQVTKPTPPGSRRAPVDTPVTSHKRKSSDPAKPARSPFFPHESCYLSVKGFVSVPVSVPADDDPSPRECPLTLSSYSSPRE